jgi:acetyl esterase
MKPDYKKLLSRLDEYTVPVQHKGIPLIIKRIPDWDEEGSFDPRVLHVQIKQARARALHPESNATPADPEHCPYQTIRVAAGWPNKDVTTTPITTLPRKLPGANGDIPIRIYAAQKEGRQPAVVYFHGGGFISGSLPAVENPCKALAEKAGAVVLSVDYRLAPEYPFPAGITDCFATVQWAARHAEELGIHPEQITVAGDSAGGNLAAVCALLDRDQKMGLIHYQALIYPVVNLSNHPTGDHAWDIREYTIRQHPELIEYAIQSLADAAPIFSALYTQKVVGMDAPYVSPLRAEDFSGLPPSIIITAEFDFLRLEGEAYARKLIRAGVPAKLIRYNGMDHGFIDKIGLYPQAEDCIQEIALGIKEMFAG